MTDSLDKLDRVAEMHEPFREPEYNSESLRVARAYARWHLGDPDWADAIIHAYLNPAEALKKLDVDREEWGPHA